jgi:hypothetical protein
MSSYGNRRCAQPLDCCKYAVEQITADRDFGQLNLARRHLSQEQKRGLIADELRADPERSNRQVAEGLGVSHVTVGGVRGDLETTEQIDQLDKTVGKDGKKRRKPIRTSYVDPTPTGEKEACWCKL